MKSAHLLYIILAFPIFVITACKDEPTPEEEETFRKEDLLQNLADNYVTPGYQELQIRVNALADAWTAFSATPSETLLEDVRTSWLSANISFNKVKVFEVGPAMTLGFKAALGTFPTDTIQIQNNITAGTYNLATAANIDAIGFDALDYLLFGTDAYNKLTTNAARMAYAGDVIAKMKSETDQVVNGWVAYKATFIAGTGTSSTSPFAILVNNFCMDFETIKSAKVGIPMGSQSLGVSQPQYLEARRSGQGKALVVANATGLRAVYMGDGYTSGSGIGFHEYLVALERSDLANTIDSRFSSIVSQPMSWTGTMEQILQTDKTPISDYYTYLQASTVYLKTDMSSAFGVLITYQDNDGD